MENDGPESDELRIRFTFKRWLYGSDYREFDPHRRRLDRPPTRGSIYPRFDAAELGALRLSLGGSPYDSTYRNWKGRLRRRARRVWARRSLPLVAALGVLAMGEWVGQLDAGGHIRTVESSLRIAIDRDLLSAVAMAIPVVACGVYMYRALTSPLERFFRLMAAAERESAAWRKGHRHFVRCMDLIGRAARMLFRYQQYSRRTWLTPPVVADIALRAALPLLNVDVCDINPDRKSGTVYDIRPLLRDISCLVAVERDDRIGDLRDHYSHIDTRHQDQESREADAKFLDPMRSKTRWDVRKDFFYPLSAWFSALVAVTALFISVLK